MGKGGVAHLHPPLGIVGMGFRLADAVEIRQVFSGGQRAIVKEGQHIGRALDAHFPAGAVVGKKEKDGVVELADAGQVVAQPADVLIHVVDKGGVVFLQPSIHPLLIGTELLPGDDAGVALGQASVFGQQSQLFLPGQAPLANDVVAFIVVFLVAGLIAGPGVVGSVGGAGGVIEEEGLVGVQGTQVANHADGLVGQGIRKVELLVLGRQELGRALDQHVGMPLAGLAIQKAPVAVKAAVGRPAVKGTGLGAMFG